MWQQFQAQLLLVHDMLEFLVNDRTAKQYGYINNKLIGGSVQNVAALPGPAPQRVDLLLGGGQVLFHEAAQVFFLYQPDERPQIVQR